MKYLLIAVGIILAVTIGFIVKRHFFTSELLQPRIGKVVESIYGLGTVMADQTYQAKVGVSLLLIELPVREGNIVKAGQVLARFDESAVRAPFTGTVTEIFFKAGEIIPPQTPILTVTNLEKIYIEVNLEQQSVLRVRPGQNVVVSFESLRNEAEKGKVKAVYPRDTQFILRIELSNWPHGVLPGMTADVAIEIGTKENALLIPLSSINAGKVTRVRKGKREKVNVKLGMVDNLWAEVVSGDLNHNDFLLTRH